ncbi:MAG: hypothetical protein R3F61_16315 [Myxococcota bacterium]
MLLTWLSLGWAAEIDLARSNRALAEGRVPDALTHARAALDADEADLSAWLAWLDACEAGGLADACRAEAAVRGEKLRVAAVAGVWHDIRYERLDEAGLQESVPELVALDQGSWEGKAIPAAQAVMIGELVEADPDAAAGRGLELLAATPSHPEVLIPLFAEGLPARSSLGKARKKLVSTGAKAIRKASPTELYRWHEVFVAVAESALAEDTAARLETAGEPRPLTRTTWTRAQSVQAARALMDGNGTLPDIVPGEREAVALRLAEMLDNAGRHEESAKQLATAREKHDSPSLAISQGEAVLKAGDTAGAARIADEALLHSILPWPTDVAGTDRISRRTGVAKSLALRGRARLEAQDHGAAAVDLMIANQLALQPLDTAALEKAMAKGRYALEATKAKLETAKDGAVAVALANARAALESGDFPTVESATSDAIAVLCLPTHQRARLTAKMAFTPELASAFALRGLARSKAGDAERARVDVAVALLLLPWDAPADWWALSAELAAGSDSEMAFFDAAMAASVDGAGEHAFPAWFGSEEAGQAAGAAMVGTWMRGHEQVEPPKDRMVVERGRVIAFRAPSGGAGSSQPVINRPFPSFSVTDAAGTIAHQPGRMEIVTFFRTDSPSSLRLLDEVTEMARELRKQRGVNVVLFGICVDPDASSLEEMRARREMWGDTKWDPDLGKRFGVTAFPTTWIVDSEGIARFKHVGYVGRSDYEAEIRFIAGI